ncbi:MAG: M24 family metallopeptidase [Gaiellales bacterium]
MTAILIVGDTERSLELRHEVPLHIGDPFLYAETGGRRVAIVWSVEGDRIAKVDPTIELVPSETFSPTDLIESGIDIYDLDAAQMARQVASLGLTSAKVPDKFPLRIADELRASGVELVVDQRLFDNRRRRKTALELEGIREASRANDYAMAAISDALARSAPGDGGRVLDGEPLTCEWLRAIAAAVFDEAGCRSDAMIVAHGVQAADGHDQGSGRIENDDAVLCDLFPLHIATHCYSDMTRTFFVGAHDATLVDWHRQTVEALELARSLVHPGANGAAIHKAICDFYGERGHPTGLSKAEGEVLRDGFYHGLGHGVGLDVHEAPFLGRVGHDLVVGDVITIEPGLYRHGWGGVRLEDLLVVTEEGCETLTHFPLGYEPVVQTMP